MMGPRNSLDSAFKVIQGFSSGKDLTERVSDFEFCIEGKTIADINRLLTSENVSESVIEAAIQIKEAFGRIHDIIHAVGILISLPYILEPSEKIEALSLAAGNTGKDFDLTTDRRVAEFTFINWQGGPESIRQNKLFVDFFNLAHCNRLGQRFIYVVGKKHPMKFFNGNRSLESVLSKNRTAWTNFSRMYGNKFKVVSEFYREFHDTVQIKDLAECVPAFRRKSLFLGPSETVGE